MTTVAGPLFARHDILRILPEDWSAALARSDAAAVADEQARALLAGWAAARRPAIVRRRSECETSNGVPLGVPLPPRHGKLRIALTLPADVTVTRVAPLGLADARAVVPAAWTGVGRALEDLGAEVGIVPQVFGALLWAALTGLDYLGPGSDLDLLWRVTAATDLSRLLRGLARIDSGGIVAIDGEILLPDGAGMQWRELARASHEPGGRVLAKTMDGVSLRRADTLFKA